MERDLSIEVKGPIVAAPDVTVDPEAEARINSGYQRLVERVVSRGPYFKDHFPEGYSFAPDPEHLARVRAGLSAALETLRPNESRILVLRNGLNGEAPRNLSEIGLTLDRPVTGERVRQLEEKAMRKLRHPSRGMGAILAEAFGKERVI